MEQDVIRVDRMTAPSLSRTDEGGLRGDAVVSRIGVFSYRNADGTERRELRHPDDVFRSDSLDTLRGIPVTIDHPAELVTADTAKDLQVGSVLENYRIDGRHIVAPMTVTTRDGVEAVQDGRRELSLGYRVDLVEEEGTYNGEAYTHRQTNVRYNHLALVAAGRAGSARINLDGASVCQSPEQEIAMSDKTLERVTLDGISYDAAPEVAKALEKAQKAEAKARADADEQRADMQKQIDTKQAEVDELKAKVKDMEDKRGDAAIDAMVKDRVALLAEAGKVVTDDLSELTPRQIREKVIAARHDGINLSEKSDDYVAARYDAVIEAVKADKAGDQVRKSTPSRADSPTDHRADMLGAFQAMSKPKSKEAH